MRFLLRADAGTLQGAGHVMRCLTLAETLLAAGHDVEFLGSVSGLDWLEDHLATFAMTVHPCEPDSLDRDFIESRKVDWVVIDSYRIEAALVSALNAVTPCLAIVDGDTRGVDATLYLDQNLGAELEEWPDGVRNRLLAGSQFALVRLSVRAARRERAWEIPATPPRVVAFMGGSDPLHASLAVGRALVASVPHAEISLVAPEHLSGELKEILAPVASGRVLAPTPDLPRLLSDADVVVSAAGTSAWDVCTLGVPSVLVAVVDNQRDSLNRALASGVALGIDAVIEPETRIAEVGPLVDRLLLDHALRRRLSENCLTAFDGAGAGRVVSAMESAYL